MRYICCIVITIKSMQMENQVKEINFVIKYDDNGIGYVIKDFDIKQLEK